MIDLVGMQSHNSASSNKAFVRIAAFLKNVITPMNMWLLEKSRGRLGNSFLGTPVLLLHTIGSKSGLERVTPLYYFERDGKILLVASNGGNPRNPAWMNNIVAHPETKINIKGKEITMHARVANPEEHQRYWPEATAFFSTWEYVQAHSVRKFPIILLEPRQADQTAFLASDGEH